MFKNFVKHNFEFQTEISEEIEIKKRINISTSAKRQNFQMKRQFIRNKKVFEGIEMILDHTHEIKESLNSNNSESILKQSHPKLF